VPRDHVYAQYVTVRDGDLPRARGAASQLDPAGPTVSADVVARDLLGRLRRQLDVHRAFEAATRVTLSSVASEEDAATHGELRVVVAELRRLVAELDDALARDAEVVEVNEGGDLARASLAPDERAVVRTHATEPPSPVTRRLRLRVSLGWEPDGGEVRLGVDAEDADGTPVDVGGYHAALDRAALDRLVSLADVAAEVAWPVPTDDAS
jgi:hypothetical protein